MNNIDFARRLRMRFVDFLVSEYGQVKPAALVAYFGVSERQARIDIDEYAVIAGHVVTLDTKTHTLTRKPDFRRIWTKPI